MASMWRKAMVYLGLQDDEGYDYDYEGYGDPEPAEVAGPRDRREVREFREARDVRVPEPVVAVRPVVREDPSRPIPTSTTPHKTHSETQPANRPAVIRTAAVAAPRVHVVEPSGFNDAQEVGDRLKANQPVVISLTGLSRELQRRLIDFSSGLAYAVGGSMARVADQVFLLMPSGMEVSSEEKDRLRSRGLYDI